MAFPKIEDFKTPWEKKGVEIDADKAKTFVYWQAAQIDRLESEKAAETAKFTKVTGELDELKRKDETEAERIKRENEELKAKLEDKSKETSESIAFGIIAEKHDLSIKDAVFISRRARGADKAEIEKDVEELVERFAPKVKTEDPDGQKNGKPTGTPRTPGGRSSSDVDPTAGKTADELFPRYGL